MKSMSCRMVLVLALLAFVIPAMADNGIDLYPVLDEHDRASMKTLPEKHGTVIDRHSIEIAWSESVDPAFREYRIYRSIAPNAPAEGEPAAIITDRGTTSTVIGNLNLATTYYFQVEVVSDAAGKRTVSNKIAATTAANGYPWSDDIEGTLAGWDTLASTWDTTSANSSSPTHSWTDSPDSNYTNLSDRVVATAINLMSATMPLLTFNHFYNVAADGDWVYVEVSEDGGSNWERVFSATGSSSGWIEEKIDLSPYRGNLNLKIRWRLVSNASGVNDGWYVDDISIGETPHAVHALPFYDNINDATHSDSLWFSSTWNRRPGGVGAGYYWDDSPNGDFPEYFSTKLTSSQNIDLSSATDPWLVFSHRLDLEFQNSAVVEISIDGGANWSAIKTWDGPLSIPDWDQIALDLSAYAGGPVRLRFHLRNDGAQTDDGWDLDKIHVGDVPENITLAILNNHYTSVDLAWDAYVGSEFGYYEVYRGGTSDFLLDKELIATITDSAGSALNDVISPDSTHHYQVFTADPDGRYLEMSNVVTRTPFDLPLLAYPFGDDLESGDDNFMPDAPWTLTDEAAHSGSYSWSDSPDSNYANSTNVSVAFKVDLGAGGAVMPELTFWHQYGFQTNWDWGYVDISTDNGATWMPVYYITGSNGEWRKARVDLTPHRGQVLYLRFRVNSDGNTRGDGWHIDDIALGETSTSTIAYPFVDDCNDSASTHDSWIPGPSGWTAPSDDATSYWSNRPTGGRPDINSTWQTMVLGNTIDLAGATNPQLRFRYRGYYNSSTRSYVQISVDDGANYTNLLSLENATDWTTVQIDLSSYIAAGPVRLWFMSWDDQYYNSPWLDIEDFSISEKPSDVTLALTDNQSYEATVCWNPSGEGAFNEYVVKRSSSPGVTRSSTTMTTLTGVNDTCYTDAGLSPYDIFYYKVYIYDTLGVYGDGSNEVERPSLEPTLLSYPFSDDMESGGGNFLAEKPWTVTTETAHGGTRSWSDSPDSNYANNSSTSLVFRVDLPGGGAVMPELTFWHRYGFETNVDWGYVDVSTDNGATWMPTYYVTGSNGDWQKARVDLTPFRGQVLYLRFRVSSNSSNRADGWHIDDIALGETGTTVLAFPFLDDFNDSAFTHDSWIPGPAGWTEPSDDATHYWSNRSTGGRPNIDNTWQTMVLGNTIDLASTTAPQLRFRYRSEYNSSTRSYLQVSVDGGANYGTLLALSDSDSWITAQIDLSGYISSGPIRFRFYSYDHQYSSTPWLDVEDFTISEKPSDVTLALTDNQSYEATVCWTPSGDGAFGEYVVKRSSSPGVTLSSSTMATLNGVNDTCYNDTGLSPYAVYYYRIFVYDTLGINSDGSNEINRPVLEPTLLSYPFSDGMESGGGNFLAEAPWTVTDETAHGGSYSWSDSPDSNYANSADVSVAFRVDLGAGGAVMPELTFWHQYGFETNSDWGYVDVSTDNGLTWMPYYYITGSNGEWRKARVDLTPFRGQVLYMRFRVSTSASGQADGWHIDDISIDETTTLALTYPFLDDFNDSTFTHDSWIPGPAGWTAPSGDGTPYWSNRSTGSRPDINATWQAMVLGNTIDLSAATEPQLRFRCRSYYNSGTRSYLQISVDDGANYTTLISLGNIPDWETAQIDLSGYIAGGPVRFRFYSYDSQNYNEPWLDVEDFTISEKPSDVTLALNDNQSYEATVCWNPSGDGAFDEYVVKRSATPGVTISSTTLATLTGVNDTCHTDTGLSPYDVYYYKVFAYDTLGVVGDGSNEVERPKVESPLLSYPFTDSLESGSGNFVFDTPWEVTTEVAHSGNSSWSDSPGGNYENNASNSLSLRIDLVGGSAVMPELTFWHQHGFETNNDWGYVEISTDNGSTWSSRYYVTGSSGAWQKTRVDLTPYRGQVLYLRFRVSAGASGQADGWHVDDISIAETTTPVLAYPFIDSFNDSAFTLANWISSAYDWIFPSDNGSHYWSNYPTGALPNYNDSYNTLVLGNNIDLTGASDPVVRLRYRSYYNSSTRTYLQVSQDDGATYSTLISFANTSSWTGAEASLAGYVGGDPIRLRVYSYDALYYNSPWCDLEDFAIVEDTAAIAQVDSCSIDYPDAVWLTAGQTSAQIFAHVYEPGITDTLGQGAGMMAQIGTGPDESRPWESGSGWTWATATYGGDAASSTMDIYYGTITAGAIGSYDFAFRFSVDGGVIWQYADTDGNNTGGGGYEGYDPEDAGEVVVTLEPDVTLSMTSIELTLPVGQTSNRVITIGNDGVGPLIFTAVESNTPPAPAEVTWLGVLPATATLQPQETENITINVDATSLQENTQYNAYVVLTLNDPDQSEIDIPVTVNVVPASSPHLGGTVLNVSQVAPEETATIEVYNADTLLATATAGSDGAYSIFGVAAGTYLVRAYSEGYYPEEDSLPIPSTGANFTIHRVPANQLTSTNVDFYGSSSNYNGAPLRAGDVVTAQDQDGIYCGTYYAEVPGHYGFLHVYGDDATTPSIDEGASVGDTLTFRINGDVAQTSGPDSPVWTFSGDIRNVELDATFNPNDTLFLDAGWNLISFNRFPLNDSLEVLLADLIGGGNLVLASSFDQEWGGAATYDPINPGFSDLWTMDADHGYWIKTTLADTLVVSGARYWSDNPLPLEQNWNLTGYMPEEAREVSTALGSIDGYYSQVSGFDEGAVTYVPGDTLFNTLTHLENGFGYWVKADWPIILTYDYEDVPAAAKRDGLALPPVSVTGKTMSAFAGATPWWDNFYGAVEVDAAALPAGINIQAKDPDGTICGEFTCTDEGFYGFMPVYGDDPNTPADEGAVAGDEITFFVEGSAIEAASGSTIWRGDQSLVNLDLSFTGVTDMGNSEVPASSFLYGATPNPFNPITTIRFDVPKATHVTLFVYEPNGRLVRILHDSQTEAGSRSVVWDGRDDNGRAVGSGVYLYRLNAGEFSKTKKVVLIK